jgi:fatty acid-binding protein DegV
MSSSPTYKYSKDFDVSGRQWKLMKQSLELFKLVEQTNHCISLHIDQRISKTMEARVSESHRKGD